MQKELKYKVGQKVNYILAGSIVFTGTITEAEAKRGLKPYTLTATDGSTKFANEQFLKAA